MSFPDHHSTLGRKRNPHGTPYPIENLHYLPGLFVAHYRAFADSFSDQIAEMFRLIVKTTSRHCFLQLDDGAVLVPDRCSDRIPPILVNCYMPFRSTEHGIPRGRQVKATEQLCDTSRMFCLYAGKYI